MLNVADEGSGLPVLLLHAYPCDHRMWQAQAAALVAAGCRVLRPDLPGFGLSPLPAAEPSMRAMAEAVLEAADARGIGSFVLGGLSMGGYVAMELLRQQPGRVRGLALVDTKATPDGPAARALREQTAQRALAAQSLAPLADGMLEGLLGETTRRTNPEATTQTRRWIESVAAESAGWAMRAMAERPDSLPTLARFAGPAVVIAGDEDTLSPAGEQEQMMAVLANARRITIPGSGHLSAVEQPDDVAAALVEFAATVAGESL